MLDGIQGNADGVCGALFHIDRHAHLLAEHTQLLHSSGAEGVAGSQQGVLPALLVQQFGQLAAHGGLTGTVQACHEDDGGMPLEVHVGGFAAHEFRQLVVNDLHHELLWLDGGQDVLSERLLLHGIGKALGYFVVDVGIEQSATHVLQRFRNIDFGDFAFTLQYFERPLQPFA